VSIFLFVEPEGKIFNIFSARIAFTRVIFCIIGSSCCGFKLLLEVIEEEDDEKPVDEALVFISVLVNCSNCCTLIVKLIFNISNDLLFSSNILFCSNNGVISFKLLLCSRTEFLSSNFLFCSSKYFTRSINSVIG